MAKLDDAARTALLSGERVVGSWQGVSDGLNHASRNPGNAIVTVTESAVVVAWLKAGLTAKALVERFEVADIMKVTESDDRLPGMAGTLERKNATKAVGRAMGNSDTRPTLTVSTRRGDISVFFKNKQRGDLRAAYVAVLDLTK